MSLSWLNAFEWTDSSFRLLESNDQTCTHLSRVPVAIRVALLLEVSTAMLRISPPLAIRTEWIASKRR